MCGRAGRGGWSAKGCEVVFRNSSHISCQCYHMTSFAVMMDISRREVSRIQTALVCLWGRVGSSVVAQSVRVAEVGSKYKY